MAVALPIGREAKPCCRCGEEKPRAEFYSDKRRIDGLRSHCKVCHNAESLAWARANPEKHRASHQVWLSKPGNRERLREMGRDWAKRNPDAMARWRAANPERAREKARRDGRNRSPELVRRWNRYNHDRRRGAKPTREALAYAEILRGDPCAYCGDRAGTVDHIVAAARGGDGEWHNFTAACQHCNGGKSAKPLLTYLLERM